MVLSKRWLNLWTTLSCLNFEQPVSGNYKNFVRNFLKNRDQQCVISKLTIDCSHGGGEMTTCLRYAHPQNVGLSISNGNLANSTFWINFTCLKALKLISCEILYEIYYWTLPCLTSLHLEKVSISQVLWFENLKELALVRKLKTDDGTITINCPKLRRLSLYPDFRHTFIVSAPSLSYLNYCSRHVSAFSARDGFPCIKQVHIDIRKSNGDFFDSSDWPNGSVRKLAMQNFISMLNAVRGTPYLQLSSETIKGLRMIPNLSEYEHTSLGNLKFISLRGPGIYDLQPPRSTDHVINYLLTNSPGAKIITS